MGERTKTDRSRRPSRDERRAHLLAAATQAVRDHGPGVSMEQLASAGGVTKPILYRHFGDRDGLCRAIGEQFIAALVERLRSTLQDAQQMEILSATIDAYLRLLEEEPALYTFVTSPQTSKDAFEETTAVLDQIARLVAVTIGDNLRAAGLDTGAAEPYAFGIVGMIHQAGDWWLRTRTMRREALTDYLTALLMGGFVGLADSLPGSARAADPDIH